MRRSERTSAERLGGGQAARATPFLFQFKLVDRLQCQQSGTVKYTSQAADNMLSLQVMHLVGPADTMVYQVVGIVVVVCVV